MTGEGVAVCIVTHDSEAELAGCLEAVGRLTYGPLEVVIVDCASADRTVEIARTSLPELPRTIVPLATNEGFAGGMNEALRLSSAPFLLTLNPDARPEPDYLERLFAAIAAASRWRVGAATGRLLRPAVAGQPRRLDACGMRLTRSWRHLDRGSGEVDRGQWCRRERVFGATGACSLFRRAALADASVDGAAFDPAFHSFREDAELCFRLRERDWEVVYEPAARAEHRRWNLPDRRRRMPAAVNYHSLKNRYLLRIYHQTGSNLLRTALPALGRDLSAFVYVCLAERSSLAAYRWLWRHRRQLWRQRRQMQERRRVAPAAIDLWFRHDALPL